MPKAQTPDNARWWSDFHRDYGQDSQHESAFTGYLVTHALPALELTPDALTQAHAAFVAYWAASQALTPTAVAPVVPESPQGQPYHRILRRR
jgi:hypothetical protein